MTLDTQGTIQKQSTLEQFKVSKAGNNILTYSDKSLTDGLNRLAKDYSDLGTLITSKYTTLNPANNPERFYIVPVNSVPKLLEASTNTSLGPDISNIITSLSEESATEHTMHSYIVVEVLPNMSKDTTNTICPIFPLKDSNDQQPVTVTAMTLLLEGSATLHKDNAAMNDNVGMAVKFKAPQEFGHKQNALQISYKKAADQQVMTKISLVILPSELAHISQEKENSFTLV